MLKKHNIIVDLLGAGHFVPITHRIQTIVSATSISEGIVHIFIPHTTVALLSMEYDAGIVADVSHWIETHFPERSKYRHHQKGFDRNGAAHLANAVLSVERSIYVAKGRISIGRYQDLVVANLQSKARSITVTVAIMGEPS